MLEGADGGGRKGVLVSVIVSVIVLGGGEGGRCLD